VKRSAAYLRKTWGEQIVGTAGMGAVFGLISFGAVILGIALFIAAAATQSPALMIAVAVGFVLTLMALALVSSTLGGIYAAAVYRYAAEGDAGKFFSADLVRGAFQRK
jgi:1,4-dihydroxy-2-naphthoate octaprenyltransferase